MGVGSTNSHNTQSNLQIDSKVYVVVSQVVRNKSVIHPNICVIYL